jgi:RHS repeat-associated protein
VGINIGEGAAFWVLEDLELALLSDRRCHGRVLGGASTSVVGASDLVHTYSGATNGIWAYTARQFVPTNFSGRQYFILLNKYNDGGPYNWSIQVYFDSAQNKVISDFDGANLPLIKGRWVDIRVEINLNTDIQIFYYGATKLYQKSWTGGVSGGGTKNIAAVDLYANGASAIYYDDISLVSPSGFAAAYAKAQGWTLEPAGNWSQFRDATNLENRTHNIFNEITAIDGDATAVTHDAAGNMTRSVTLSNDGVSRPTVFTWDAWNRLIRLSETSGVTIATYTYDGDWKRLKKVVATNVTEYYYDDMQLAEIRQIGATGQVTQTESLVYDTRYLHSVACRDIYSGASHSSLVTRHFVINDGNFNVTALVSTNPAIGGAGGAVVERYTYDPYGKVTIRDATWQPITWDASQKNICLYTGHKYDAESGLYYSMYRYYHPGLGRWVSRDPKLEIKWVKNARQKKQTLRMCNGRNDGSTANTKGLSEQSYLGFDANPTRYSDPDGLENWCYLGCAAAGRAICWIAGGGWCAARCIASAVVLPPPLNVIVGGACVALCAAGSFGCDLMMGEICSSLRDQCSRGEEAPDRTEEISCMRVVQERCRTRFDFVPGTAVTFRRCEPSGGLCNINRWVPSPRRPVVLCPSGYEPVTRALPR